jgi:MFS family permease
MIVETIISPSGSTLGTTAPPQVEQSMPARHDPYAALKIPSFRYFAIGNVLFVIAYQMQAVAVGWEIYDRTRSPMALGWVGLVEFLPVLVLGLAAGHVADRFDRKRVVMLCVAIVALASICLALISVFHWPVLAIYGTLLVIGIGRAFQQPAKASLLPQIVPLELFSNAVTWMTGGFHLASVMGPALGGMIIWLAGGTLAVYVSAAVCVWIFVLCLLRVSHRHYARTQESPSWRSIFAGLSYIWQRQIIMGAITLDLFAVLLGGATTLLPIYARDILHVESLGFGTLRAAPAVGALCMAFLVAHRPPGRRAGIALMWSVAGFGVATVVFGLSRSFPLSLAMLFLIGALDNISVVIRQTLVQMLTPDEMRGRVAAVNSVFIGASNELGGFESGALAAWIGPVASVVSGGVGTLLVVLVVCWVWPQLVRYNRLDLNPHGT